ncbi:hypothetical protein [Sphingomonas sp. UYEF23]|uniref:hypothetical protein n=1 Tax=Sphingomonas sp. UYEF23 TaxID=1756408 RepID=UPI003396A173
MSSHPALAADQLVTASDLVRHFGAWQERAARAPLYILHHGRPRFVLTSIETMDALCAAQPSLPAPTPIDAIAVLDAIGDSVLVADWSGAILGSSRAARAYFGVLARPGAPVDAIVPPGVRATLAAAIRQVIDRGIGERLEIASAARAGRMLLLAIEPAGGGVAIIAQDATRDRDSRAAHATSAALAVAGIATVTLDPDGMLGEPISGAFGAMLDLASAVPFQQRFAAFFATDERPAFEAALADALGGKATAPLDSALLRAAHPALRVRIALAPIRRDGAIVGAVAVIVAACQISDLV